MGFFTRFLEIFNAPDIDYKQLIHDGAKVIDVRSPAEYANGHIENSINIPHNAIGQSISSVVPDKDASIIVYCHSGARAGFARGALEKAGYTKVTNGRSYSYLQNRLKSNV